MLAYLIGFHKAHEVIIHSRFCKCVFIFRFSWFWNDLCERFLFQWSMRLMGDQEQKGRNPLSFSHFKENSLLAVCMWPDHNTKGELGGIAVNVQRIYTYNDLHLNKFWNAAKPLQLINILNNVSEKNHYCVTHHGTIKGQLVTFYIDFVNKSVK